MTTQTKEFHCDGGRPEGKSYAQYQAFMQACREGKKVLIVFPFGKMYSPEMMKEILQEERKKMKQKCIDLIPSERAKSQLKTMSENDRIEDENVLLWEIRDSISKIPTDETL